MVRTALLILSGNAATSFLLLLRNLVIARLIPVPDYGIASTFAVVVSLLELASALGLQQQIVQAKEGNDPHFQAALQGFQLLRGIVSGFLLLILADPLASFMQVPEVTWAYRCLAVIPVLNALQHFDIHRLNRDMSFGPMLLTRLVPAVLSLVIVWPLAVWLNDYRVMLSVLIAQALLMAIASHVVAKRRWQLRWDRRIMGSALSFGWPLLLNNAMLFGVFQGDRIIVARELGTTTLGIFSMGVTLTLAPTLVLAKSTQNFFLPQLSNLRANRGADPDADTRLDRLSFAAIEVPLLAGALFVLGTALLGQPIVHLMLGEKYLPLMPFLVWLAVMQALRMAKAGPNIVALSAGHTSNAMAANSLRLLVLPAAWYVATTSGELLRVIQLAALGELAGFLLATGLLAKRTDLSVGRLAATGGALVAFYGATLYLSDSTPDTPTVAAWVVLPALLLISVLTMRNLRSYAVRTATSGTPT